MHKHEKAVFDACERRFALMMKDLDMTEDELIRNGKSRRSVAGRLIAAVGQWRKWKRSAQHGGASS